MLLQPPLLSTLLSEYFLKTIPVTKNSMLPMRLCLASFAHPLCSGPPTRVLLPVLARGVSTVPTSNYPTKPDDDAQLCFIKTVGEMAAIMQSASGLNSYLWFRRIIELD